jgi:hypothetical protein
MVPSNSLGKKIHPFGWISGIAASLCFVVYNNPNAPRVASGVKHNMINFVNLHILAATQQPHNYISVNGISLITNADKHFFLENNFDPSFALQAKCSLFAIAKTKDAVVVLAAAHCPPSGNQVRTAHGQGLGPVEKVFSTTISQDLVLAVISATPEVLSTITPIPVATPEESERILSQTKCGMNVMAVGYPQMNPFVSNVQMNRTFGGDRHSVAIAAPLVRVGEGENPSSVLNVGLLSTATGFSGGALVGLSGNDLRIVGVITGQKLVNVIKGNQEINVHFLSTKTFPTTKTAICVQGNGGENVSLSLEEVVKEIASLTPCQRN